MWSWEVGEGKVRVVKVEGKASPADVGTKFLSATEFDGGPSVRGRVSDCSGPDLSKCDDAHAPAGGRETQTSSSDDTHVMFQDYRGANVTLRPLPWL